LELFDEIVFEILITILNKKHNFENMGYDFCFTIKGKDFRDEIRVSRHNHLLNEIAGERDFSYLEIYVTISDQLDKMFSEVNPENREQIKEIIIVLTSVMSFMDRDDQVSISYC